MPPSDVFTPATEKDLQILAQQLGRQPRGVLGIAARCAAGHPAVVATAPRLPDGSPFPTFYYLTCPGAVRACSHLEANQFMEQANEMLQDDATAQAYARAHRAYIADRERHGQVEQIMDVSAGGMPTRVKCLHALVGHALAAGPGVNPIGDWALEMAQTKGLWSRQACDWKEES